MENGLTNRIDVINYIINKKNYIKYLEIGCYDNSCFDNINCLYKVGVDSTSGGTIRATSDQFFAKNTENFDIIFIDADHHESQVCKDFFNAVKFLNKNGIIILHDCFPPSKEYENQELCGTAWRAFYKIRRLPSFDSVLMDLDMGLGLVRRAWNTGVTHFNEITYDEMTSNAEKYMRLMSVEKSIEWINYG